MKRSSSATTKEDSKRGKTVSRILYDPHKPIPKKPLKTLMSDTPVSSPWAANGRDEYKPVQLFIQRYGLFKHQFDTFEHFVNHGIRSIIDDEGDLLLNGADGKPCVSFNFSSINVRKPYRVNEGKTVPVYPGEIRMQHSSYLANVTADVTIMDISTNKPIEVLRNKTVCCIPVMLGSSLCNLYGLTDAARVAAGELVDDQGGYFIIGGLDRVLTSQVKRCYNGSVLCRKADRWVCEMRSMNVETGKSVQVAVHTDKTYPNRMVVTVANKVSYCMMEVFEAMGVTEDRLLLYVGEDIAQFCLLTRGNTIAKRATDLIAAVRASKLNRAKITSVVNCMLSGRKFANEAEGVSEIAAETTKALQSGIAPEDIIFQVRWALSVAPVTDIGPLFPHIGNHGSNEARAQCLGRMVRRLGLAISGKHTVDDRGDYSNKRIEAAGILLYDLFKMLWKQFLADIKQAGVTSWTSTTQGIERDFKRCFMSGHWGAKNSTFKLTGVVETMMVKASHQIQTCLLRKVKLHVNADNKNRKIRELHPSTEYSLCISETVEGQDVGTRLGLAICAFVSCGQNVVLVKKLVRHVLGKELLSETPTLTQTCAVVVNGALVAYSGDPDRVISGVDNLRRVGALAIDTSVAYDATTNVVDIWVDGGRLLRPVYDLDVATPDSISAAKSFGDLEQSGSVVMRDVNELSAQPIVLIRPEEREQYNDGRYCELHPACLYGVLASDIVFVNHTQSPRACYMTCMARHSMGTRLAIQPFAPQSYTLNMPQKPLVTTRIAQMCGFDESPNGVNAIVAVLAYSGFNQEDSVIINRSSVQRGLFSTTMRRIVTVETTARVGVVEDICLPPPELRIHPPHAYRHLGEDGLLRLGSVIEKGDVIVGRVARAGGKGRETSAIAKLHEDGLVKMVFNTTNRRSGVIKIVLVETGAATSGPTKSGDTPVATLPDIEIGDKVCSSMAQKGVCGMLYNQEDMPFTAEGITPDVIINPLCMISRMTINQYTASVMGKVAAQKGERYDGSPFQRSTDTFRAACNELGKLGFFEDGTEVMYSGITGERFHTRVFIGPVYYRRLTQLVRSAIFASVENNVRNRITRQPLNGRINDGGLRVGEMESQTLMAHGVPHFHQEKLLSLSDEFTTRVCPVCKSDGLVYQDSNGVYRCRPRLGKEGTCNGHGQVSNIRLPAATRQLFHLTEAMNVVALTE